MSPDERIQLIRDLDRCDAALNDKTALANIFNSYWRSQFRRNVVKANAIRNVAYPISYAVPILCSILPDRYQYRLEEGLGILLPKLSPGDRNNLVERMRCNGSPSAEEELLLARGFALEFGPDSIKGHYGNANSKRAEFSVRLNGMDVDIEAKGLIDSQRVQQLNKGARLSAQDFWFSNDPAINSVGRLRTKLGRTLSDATPNRPLILTLTQYSTWPPADESVRMARQISMDPTSIGVDEDKFPLAVALICRLYIQGVWFNNRALISHDVDQYLRERLRNAVRNSFYPRPDDIFFDELIDEETHNSLLDKMRGRNHDVGA